MTWDRTKGRPEPIAALNRIVEEENGEPLVGLREAAPSVRIFRKSTIPFCRKTVAEMVERAARSLPDGYFLSVTSAYRPFEWQAQVYEWMTKCAAEAFPGISYAALRRRVNRWVAPVDQPAPPGHTTGAAIDVYLVDAENKEHDVCSPLERFRANPTYAFGLGEEAHRNRMTLVSAMLDQGFSNCRDEWWHYSYGDAGWAVRMGEPTCFYGHVALDPKEYRHLEKSWRDRLKRRENPFLAGR